MIHITSSRETRHLWWRHPLHCTQSYQMSLISPDPSEADNLGNLSHLSPFLMIGRQQTGSSLPHSVSLRPEMITSWRWHRAPALLCGPQPQHICISNVSMCYRQNIVQHFNEKSCTRTVELWGVHKIVPVSPTGMCIVIKVSVSVWGVSAVTAPAPVWVSGVRRMSG